MKGRQIAVLAAFLGILIQTGAQTDPPKKPIRVRISAGLTEKLKTHDVKPDYPMEAIRKGVQGTVLLLAEIDVKGNVTDVRIVQGDPVLAQASMEAVKQWRYKPYLINGQPVTLETTIKIQFHL